MKRLLLYNLLFVGLFYNISCSSKNDEIISDNNSDTTNDNVKLDLTFTKGSNYSNVVNNLQVGDTLNVKFLITI